MTKKQREFEMPEVTISLAAGRTEEAKKAVMLRTALRTWSAVQSPDLYMP